MLVLFYLNLNLLLDFNGVLEYVNYISLLLYESGYIFLEIFRIFSKEVPDKHVIE